MQFRGSHDLLKVYPSLSQTGSGRASCVWHRSNMCLVRRSRQIGVKSVRNGGKLNRLATLKSRCNFICDHIWYMCNSDNLYIYKYCVYMYVYIYTPATVLFYNYTPSNIETPWFEMLDAGNDGWHVETRPRRPSRRLSQRKTTCQGYSVGCVPKGDGRWRIRLKHIKHCYTYIIVYLYWVYFRYDILYYQEILN